METQAIGSGVLAPTPEVGQLDRRKDLTRRGKRGDGALKRLWFCRRSVRGIYFAIDPTVGRLLATESGNLAIRYFDRRC